MHVVESVEHMFLSQCVTSALSQLSQTNLYAYVEAERRKFDFACELKRDWSRPLVGQTLWNHTASLVYLSTASRSSASPPGTANSSTRLSSVSIMIRTISNAC